MFYWCRYPVPVSLGSIPLDGSIQLCVVSMCLRVLHVLLMQVSRSCESGIDPSWRVCSAVCCFRVSKSVACPTGAGIQFL